MSRGFTGTTQKQRRSVLTMETSIIPEAKESMAGPQQRQGYVDHFFFDSCGVVHHEYAPQGQTVTKEYY